MEDWKHCCFPCSGADELCPPPKFKKTVSSATAHGLFLSMTLQILMAATLLVTEYNLHCKWTSYTDLSHTPIANKGKPSVIEVVKHSTSSPAENILCALLNDITK